VLSRAWARLPWAFVNSVLWMCAASWAITAVVAPSMNARAMAVLVAMGLVALWVAHTLADHYDEVADENDMLHGQRHVVFGASEEATHALCQQIPQAWATARASMARSRRRRSIRSAALWDIPARDDRVHTQAHAVWADEIEGWTGALSDR
jgi:hypothetical protein